MVNCHLGLPIEIDNLYQPLNIIESSINTKLTDSDLFHTEGWTINLLGDLHLHGAWQKQLYRLL